MLTSVIYLAFLLLLRTSPSNLKRCVVYIVHVCLSIFDARPDILWGVRGAARFSHAERHTTSLCYSKNPLHVSQMGVNISWLASSRYLRLHPAIWPALNTFSYTPRCGSSPPLPSSAQAIGLLYLYRHLLVTILLVFHFQLK